MSQSFFSLGFLSQNSLWKLSTIRGYKGYLYWCVFGMRKVSFFQTKWSSDWASQLDWVTSSSRELTVWPAWDFCPVVQQLAWLFSSPACFTRVSLLATCQPQATREIQSQVLVECILLNFSSHSLTLSHTLPLHNFHLNIRFLNAELQENLARNKANKMVD